MMISRITRTRKLAAAMALLVAFAVFGGPVVEPASAMAPVCKKSELCGGNETPWNPYDP